MSDIVETLRFMSYPEAGMAADEITRLRSLLKEAGGALERLYNAHPEDESRMDFSDWSEEMKAAQDEWVTARDNARTVLSKIKGEA